MADMNDEHKLLLLAVVRLLALLAMVVLAYMVVDALGQLMLTTPPTGMFHHE